MSTLLQKLQKHLTYERTATIPEIVADFNQIVEIDKLSELKQKEYGTKALYYFLGLAVSIVLIFVIRSVASDDSYLRLVIPLLLVAIIGFIIAWIYALFLLGKYRKLNVSNYRYELTKQVLQMLTRDIDNTSNIDLQLSFKAIPAKENKKDTIAHPHKSGWKIDNYQDEWLKIQGQFLDKTRFGLTAIGLSKTEYGWKRGRSGKSKYKSKTKNLGLEVILRLTYPLKRYGAVKVLQNEAMGAIQLPTFCQIRGLKITDKSINLAVRISPDMSEKNQGIYQTITMMFLSLYQVLNLAKILSK
jgi:hypothetical protein